MCVARKFFKKRKPAGAVTKRTIASLSRALGIELKFKDTSLNSDALTAPSDAAGGEHDPSATLKITSLAEGSAKNNRDGRKIIMKRLDIYGSVATADRDAVTALETQTSVVIYLVLDRTPNGITLSSEDVFTNGAGSANLATRLFRDMEHVDKYRVLARVDMDLPVGMPAFNGATMDVSGVRQSWEMHVNLRDMQATYSATTAVIASQVTNSIHIVAYCNNTDAAPQLSWHARLRYVG